MRETNAKRKKRRPVDQSSSFKSVDTNHLFIYRKLTQNTDHCECQMIQGRWLQITIYAKQEINLRQSTANSMHTLLKHARRELTKKEMNN